MLRFFALLALLCPAALHAQPVQLTYAGYVAGLNIFAFHATADLGGGSYRVETGYRTSGLLGAFVAGDLHTLALGHWREGAAVPVQFQTWGLWRGDKREMLIEYVAGQPNVRKAIPPIAGEREPVSLADQANTIDTLSGFAHLTRQVNETGKCAAQARMFDGRRLVAVSVVDRGMETLEPDSAAMHAGTALRCDMISRQIAGFAFDDGRDPLATETHGTLWYARPLIGAPMMPVRMSFELHMFGHATMYLGAAKLVQPTVMTRPAG